jgi:glutaredoxin-like protein NrdH
MTSHNKFKLFALSTCSHCKAVKNLLSNYNIDVDVVNIDDLENDDRKDALAEVKRYNERISFPTTVIGDEVIVGYKADRIKKALQRE